MLSCSAGSRRAASRRLGRKTDLPYKSSVFLPRSGPSVRLTTAPRFVLLQVEEGLHAGILGHVAQSPIVCEAHNGAPCALKCSGEVNSPCAKVSACGENACTAQSAAPSAMGSRGAGRQKAKPPDGRLCRRERYLLQVEESLHAGVLGHVAQSPIVCEAHNGAPCALKCSGEVNSPCAKVSACGENACTAQSAAPSAMGPRGAGRRERQSRPVGRLCCKTWNLTSG